MSELAVQLHALREGRASFAAFLRATRQDWRKMSAKLYRRWALPAGVTEEDVEQEMLLAADAGYSVVHGGSLSAGEWANARRAEAILPAGRVTPSHYYDELCRLGVELAYRLSEIAGGEP